MTRRCAAEQDCLARGMCALAHACLNGSSCGRAGDSSAFDARSFRNTNGRPAVAHGCPWARGWWRASRESAWCRLRHLSATGGRATRCRLSHACMRRFTGRLVCLWLTRNWSAGGAERGGGAARYRRIVGWPRRGLHALPLLSKLAKLMFKRADAQAALSPALPCSFFPDTDHCLRHAALPTRFGYHNALIGQSGWPNGVQNSS